MLSAVVLGLAFLSVIAFAYAYQHVRHTYLARLSSMLSRTEEAISVSGWTRELYLLVEISNNGGTGVLAREVKTVVQVSMEIPYGGRRITSARTAVFTEHNIYLRPREKHYLWYNLTSYIPRTATNATISFATVTIVTERNVFIFDVLPPLDRLFITITKEYIREDKSLVINLPDGRTAMLKPYEVMFCSISSGTRTFTPVPEYDSTLLIIQSKDRYVGAYHYGYDPVNKTWNRVEITIERHNENNADICELVAPRHSGASKTFPPYDTQIVFARGLLLVGTHLHNYDIEAVLFASGQFPKPVRLSSGVPMLFMVNVSTVVVKIGLASPESDVSVFDFIGTHVVPVMRGIRNMTNVVSVGSFYSQAILVLQVVHYRPVYEYSDIVVGAVFPPPYPVAIILRDTSHS